MANQGGASPPAEPTEPARGTQWRGRRGSAQKVIRHRWQKDWSAQTPEPTQLQEQWRRFRIGGLLALALGLAAFFVYYLLLAPARTPLIAISSTAYRLPLPPNAWAREDLEGLLALDEQTLNVADVSSSWQSKDHGLRDLQRQLREARSAAVRGGALVLYVSMHSAVDGRGRPCLIPTGASPHVSEQWLPLGDLLAAIRAAGLPDDLHKLLILDAARLPVEWSIGLLENDFADRLPAVVDAADIPNFALLTSAGTGQIAWTAPELKGSVFGHFLGVGMAGAADNEGLGGDGDRRVSLHELHGYLARHVDRWTRHNRGVAQQPLLLPAKVRNFPVAWALNPLAPKRIAAGGLAASRPEPAVSGSQRAVLWQTREELKAHAPYRLDPLAWRDFEQQLLWLEQLVDAGAAYHDLARQTFAQLQQQAGQMQARAAAARQHPSVLAEGQVFGGARRLSSTLHVHSLPLAELFGAVSPDEAEQVRAAQTQFAQTGSRSAISATLEALGETATVLPLAELHLLRLLDRYRTPELWGRPELLARALAVRDAGERVSVPADERVQYWIARQVAVADQERRLAEDVLLAGPQPPDAAPPETDPLERWERVATLYEAAAEQSTLATQAYAARDSTWAELPYLARWLTHPYRDGDATGSVRETLLPLIENTHALALGLALDERAGAALPFADELHSVEQQLDELRGLFTQECLRLAAERDASPAVVRGLEIALACPLIPAPQRTTLEQKYVRFRERLAQTVPTGEEISQADLDAFAPAAAVNVLSGFGSEHPALMILNRDSMPSVAPAGGAVTAAPPGTASDAAALAQGSAATGEQVRQLLASVRREIVRHRDRPTEAAAPGTSSALRPGWVEAEMARAAAGLGVHFDDDPIERLRTDDLQQLLIWQAHRALDDFWGPAAAGERPFFETVVDGTRPAIAALGDVGPLFERRLSELEQLTGVRRHALRDGLVARAAGVLVIEPDETVSTQVVVGRGDAAAADVLPEGVAGLFVRDDLGRVPGAAVRLPLADLEERPGEASLSIDYPLQARQLAARGPEMMAVLMFRGHEFTAPFLVGSAGGVVVDFEPYRYGASQITLGGSRRRKASVVFILDCSASMAVPMEIEAPSLDGLPPRVPRLGVAQDALRSMLNELAERRDARVGVLFYGHRVGWDTRSGESVLVQKEYNGTIPPALQPYEDVETVLSLGRFDRTLADRVSERMATVRPWGESPIYLSLTTALQEFTTDEAETDKSVVLITDGLNNQRNPSAAKARSRADVLAALATQPDVRVHIVGFGISAEDAGQAAAEFDELARRTDGSYARVTEATSLIRSLERLLGTSLYAVTDDAGTELASTRLGMPVVVPPARRPAWYEVTVEDLQTSVEILGGEALELVIGGDGQAIESVRYEAGSPRFGRLVSGSPPASTDYLLGVHRPVRREEGVYFRVSLQRESRQFVPRPAEVWLEVTPLFEDGRRAAEAYTFYDAHYEPGTPVPVLSWLAADWPAAALRAEVRFWCKPRPTEPTRRVALAELDAQAAESGLPLVESAQVNYQVRIDGGGGAESPLRIGVIERHLGDELGFQPLKVELRPPAGRAVTRTVRRYDAQHQLATHRFELADSDAGVASGAELLLTTREATRRDSWELEKPIEVEISSAGDLLPPPPPTPAALPPNPTEPRRLTVP